MTDLADKMSGIYDAVQTEEVSPQAEVEPFLIRLEHIALPPNLPAGLSPWMLGAIAHERRNTGRQVRDPILVRRHPEWPGGWLIVDGRHRYCASVMAGCVDILAVEVA